MTEARRSPLMPLSLLATLTLLTPLAACAADGAPTEHEALVDLSELRAIGDASFARLDLDGDGMITEAEFTSAGPGAMAPGGAPFVFMHRDGDDVEIEVTGMTEWDLEVDADTDTEMDLEIAEGDQVHAYAFAFAMDRDDATAFAEMDANGDGMVSLAEYEARPQQERRIRREIIIDDAAEAASAFGAFDANADGVITRNEWPSPETHLSAMDLDGDGRLTLSEMGGDGDQQVIRQRRIIRSP